MRNAAKTRRDELKRRLNAHRPPVQSISDPQGAPETPSRTHASALQPVQAPWDGPNWIPTRTARSLPARPEQDTNKDDEKEDENEGELGWWKRSGFAGAPSQDDYRKVIGQTGTGLCSQTRPDSVSPSLSALSQPGALQRTNRNSSKGSVSEKA
ncbi:hypothetical protein MGYG_08139 [Nannizzia gypsea CBS 118893]|uniref:Uncharacterized protein n=1 Tax=Arthroderma gypseum (strain ATCC MYA-4604 / CBS 118893) TaxID=535722 RepID=E4V553_ARTGP|nr:hypothetical protein MGYG_08139 [Nannizzia gypsea CBS 118893]EFR05127.1 hypothetical protein MGYG_08139 [Nannizzia gypsea CBS 118893]